MLTWQSPENGASVRHSISGIPLDPIWEDGDNSLLLSAHGDYIFVINPRLEFAIPTLAPQPPLGSLDQEFLSAFLTYLPALTADLSSNAANVQTIIAPPTPYPSAQGFFRVSANWALDSDADEIFHLAGNHARRKQPIQL